MNFRDFDLARSETDFGLSVDMTQPLFDAVPPIALSPSIAAYWDDFRQLGLNV